MGAFIGLILGVGLLLVVRGTGPPPAAAAGAARTAGSRRQRRADLLRQAGIEGVSHAQLIALQAISAVAAAALVLVVSGAITVALAFAVIAFRGPPAVVRRLRDRRVTELREVWPEVVDNLSSAVRAGLSLPEAVSALGVRGPEQLRPAFQRFAVDYRATGRFAVCLDRLKDALADPVGDRVCEALRMAREVGGTDLGRLLRTLSAFLREDARTRAELETRQGWTINAARQ